MDDAMLTMDPEKVKGAIAKAKEGGVDAAEVTRIEHALDAMLADGEKMAKLKALGDALQSKDITQVKKCIADARAGGVPEEDMKHYDDALKELEVEADRKAKVAAMDAALAAKDIEKLKAALKDCQHAGVDTDSLERGQNGLGELVAEEDKKQKLKALQDAIASSDIGKIQEAMEPAQKA